MDISLRNYATSPLYNIKAVVQATRVSPSTLRAWERRYNVCQPQRSESGYRLYSDRDIALIRWLKMQVDAGLSISQAVTWYENLVEEAGNIEQTTLPASNGHSPGASASVIGTPTASATPTANVLDFSTLQHNLLNALLSYDEETAERYLSAAFALHSIEHVSDHVIAPVLVEIGERWHRGELNITSEHFATSYLRQRLFAIMRSVPNSSGPLVWVGCAPSEMHEIGSIMLCIHLRRAGYTVHYFGQNLHIDDFVSEVVRYQPAAVAFSATTAQAANSLAEMTARLTELAAPRPLVGYGGQIFVQQPALRKQTAGVFLGTTTTEAVEAINDLLRQGAPVLQA